MRNTLDTRKLTCYKTDVNATGDATMPKPYKKIQDIPPFVSRGAYMVHVSWNHLEHQLQTLADGFGLDMDPDFQRGHVWTMEQQIAYVEHCLRGGQASNQILWNCRTWNTHITEGPSPVQLVDGKQRITAVLAFLRDEIPAFGRKLSEYEDGLAVMEPRLVFHVNSLKTKAEVLQWYLELNSGGTVHSDAELGRVRQMLKEEQDNDKRGKTPGAR